MNDNLQFQPDRFGILFFSRGRGSGHAIPDAAIAKELAALNNELDIRFASYATGVDTLSGMGLGVIDLGLPEANDPVETLVLAARVIGFLRPKLVIAHEEFAALPAAKITSIRTAFLTDWFVEPEDFNMNLLSYADEIIFLDEDGIFEEPPQAEGRVHYAKPVLREFQYSRADRERARAELDLPPGAVVISVIIPPGRRVESVAPLYDLLMPAFEALDEPEKLLLWLAGDDYGTLSQRARSNACVIVKRNVEPFDRLMVATDLAFTKGNRNIVLELAELGIPSISVSHRLNLIDDLRGLRVRSNRVLYADETSSEELLNYIKKFLAAGRLASENEATAPEPWAVGGAQTVAETLADIAGRIAAQPGRSGSD